MPARGLTLTPELRSAERAESLAAEVGERIGIDGVLADLRRTARPATDERHPDAPTLRWDDADDADDAWWPQGLTTDAEAGSAAGAGVVLAAWYAKGLRGRLPNVAVRVSVLSLAEARYDHVLLVDPRRTWRAPQRRHGPVPVHAGGLVWIGDLLLVADTRRGFRVFDLRDVTRLARPVQGCRFALPQRGRWTSRQPSGEVSFRWSFASVDPEGPWLLAGEYARPGTGTRLVRHPLAPLLAGEPAEAAEVVVAGLPSMQGVARVDGTWWVSTSRGVAHRGRLWHGTSDGAFERIDDALPVGCEDLSYDRAGRLLWTQGEHPGQRLVLAVPLPGA